MSFRRPKHHSDKANEPQSRSNFHGASGNAPQSQAEIKSVEQLIQLMSQVNAAVKNGDFGTHLANNIFQLCQKLKTMGQHLEQTHKAELNKVFVSLRQASCRDNGQLGTPCRLKVMELIELRAMGWRPNMAHSQYYINKAEESRSEPKKEVFENPSPSVPAHKAPPAREYQPNYGSPFVPSFVAQQPMYEQQPMGPGPGYFLIPANAPWSPQMMGPGMMPPFQHPMRPPTWLRQNPVAAAVGAHFNLDGFQPKPTKSAQLREEITIKNADSGKIMGVKGRRVAVVEELSKTIISFQKVDHNSKYRILAISGGSPESIQHAKRLIEETIRRNVSPNRMETSKIQAAEPASEQDEEEEEDGEDGPDVTIETGNDGSLKVSCADPEMLEAAQAALREYINLRTGRMSAKEREEKKDRRKSMPIPSSAEAEEKPAQKSVEEGMAPKIVNGTLKAHGSTPNLMAESIKPLVGRDLRYDRPTMLAIKESVEGVAADGKLMEKAAQLNASAQPTNDLSDSNAD